jgi:hypothetical protein
MKNNWLSNYITKGFSNLKEVLTIVEILKYSKWDSWTSFLEKKFIISTRSTNYWS